MWQEEQARLDALGKETSWEMYRRKLKAFNRNKLIVFVATYFGIFLSHEVMMLADVPVHNTAKELGVTRTSIYTKYTGLSPPLIALHTGGKFIYGTIIIFNPYIGVPGGDEFVRFKSESLL